MLELFPGGIEGKRRQVASNGGKNKIIRPLLPIYREASSSFFMACSLTLSSPRYGLAFVGAGCDASQLWWLHHCGLSWREPGNGVQKWSLCQRAPRLRGGTTLHQVKEKDKQKLYIRQKYFVNLPPFKRSPCQKTNPSVCSWIHWMYLEYLPSSKRLP